MVPSKIGPPLTLQRSRRKSRSRVDTGRGRWISVAGGGDTVAALNQRVLADSFHLYLTAAGLP